MVSIDSCPNWWKSQLKKKIGASQQSLALSTTMEALLTHIHWGFLVLLHPFQWLIKPPAMAEAHNC